MRRQIFTVCLLVAMSLSSNQAFGAAAKTGAACPKSGLKSGFLTCVKIDKKLKWQIVKTAQAITFSVADQGSINDGSISFMFSSSSKLRVTAAALTPNVCNLGKSLIVISGTPGICRFSLTQNGNTYFTPAKSVLVEVKIYGTNIIDFHLPGALLLSQGTYPLTATSNSNLTVTFISSTQTVCTVADLILTLVRAGTCTVVATQQGGDLIPPAEAITQSVEISMSRVTADLPDTVNGFQIKPVYVVPSDGTDNSYDTNGYLAGILDGGNSYLNSQIGYTVPVDKTLNGYDIQYLKSQYSTEYLRTHASTNSSASDASVLMTEIKAMESPGDNRKDYIFFIEVPGFENAYCGYAATPGLTAVIALQNVSSSGYCTGDSPPFFSNYTSKTWVHELMHNFGVAHTMDDPCDLMASGGTPCKASVKYTMDKERTRYAGAASTQGPNILSLRVWQGYTSNQSMRADCILNPIARADGVPYAYCPTGSQALGSFNYCWSQINSVELQEQINGLWVSLGTGNYFSQPWGARILAQAIDCGTNFAPWKELTVTTPGLRHYQWIVNGQVAEAMNVFWVN
jgi:predicted Zn-dependent protease